MVVAKKESNTPKAVPRIGLPRQHTWNHAEGATNGRDQAISHRKLIFTYTTTTRMSMMLTVWSMQRKKFESMRKVRRKQELKNIHCIRSTYAYCSSWSALTLPHSARIMQIRRLHSIEWPSP